MVPSRNAAGSKNHCLHLDPSPIVKLPDTEIPKNNIKRPLAERQQKVRFVRRVCGNSVDRSVGMSF